MRMAYQSSELRAKLAVALEELAVSSLPTAVSALPVLAPLTSVRVNWASAVLELTMGPADSLSTEM